MHIKPVSSSAPCSQQHPQASCTNSELILPFGLGCMAWDGRREAARHEDDASSASAALLWHRTGSAMSSGQGFPVCTLPGSHFSLCAKRSLLNFLVTQCAMAKTGDDKRLVKNCNLCFQDHFFHDLSFVQITTALHSPRGNGQFQ